jgi:hypothetical protein
MAVPVWARNLDLKKITKIVTAEVKFFRIAEGYTRKDQIRYAEIRKELNIFNLYNKIVKFI